METPPHCTVPAPLSRPNPLWLLPLTGLVLLVHGYHPFAEDGGLYLAGVAYDIDPALFPRETAFATAQMQYSFFAPAFAALTRIAHLPLPTILCCGYLLSAALLLFASLRIAEACFPSRAARWTAVVFLAACWTMPLAGTSLLLMDPYLSARSLASSLSLLAVAAALSLPQSSGRQNPWRHPALRCGLLLTLAAAFHPPDALYALAFVLILRMVVQRAPPWLWAAFVTVVCLLAATVQALTPPECPAALAADASRSYWFLSQWRWFEWLGLLAPLGIYAALLRWRPLFLRPEVFAICRSSVVAGSLAIVMASVFAQKHFTAHPIARLQPLRLFLLPSLLLFLLLGGVIADRLSSAFPQVTQICLRRLVLTTPALLAASVAVTMALVQRRAFPDSPHLELPGAHTLNPWVEAFLWARDHTSTDALFALDARYVNAPGEDAQTFRAVALRSALPDFSKDGGAAANTPALAVEWQRAVTATQDLSQLDDRERDARLRPFDVQWMVLRAEARTVHPCPYRNAAIKVCRLETGRTALIFH